MEAVGDLRWMIEMLVQGVNVFEDAATAADDKVVNRDDMLGVFREGDSTDMLGMRKHISQTYIVWILTISAVPSGMNVKHVSPDVAER